MVLFHLFSQLPNPITVCPHTQKGPVLERSIWLNAFLDNFVFHFVFCKWNLMRQESIHVNKADVSICASIVLCFPVNTECLWWAPQAQNSGESITCGSARWVCASEKWRGREPQEATLSGHIRTHFKYRKKAIAFYDIKESYQVLSYSYYFSVLDNHFAEDENRSKGKDRATHSSYFYQAFLTYQ